MEFKYSQEKCLKIWGRFPFDENFRFEFPEISKANETAFSGISEKEMKLAW